MRPAARDARGLGRPAGKSYIVQCSTVALWGPGCEEAAAARPRPLRSGHHARSVRAPSGALVSQTFSLPDHLARPFGLALSCARPTTARSTQASHTGSRKNLSTVAATAHHAAVPRERSFFLLPRSFRAVAGSPLGGVDGGEVRLTARILRPP